MRFQEIILTVVLFYVLFKIFGESSKRAGPKANREGDIKIDNSPDPHASQKKKKDDDEGEYVDFEEIK